MVSETQPALECAAQLYPAPGAFRKAVHQCRARGGFLSPPAAVPARTRISCWDRRATATGSGASRCLPSGPRIFSAGWSRRSPRRDLHSSIRTRRKRTTSAPPGFARSAPCPFSSNRRAFINRRTRFRKEAPGPLLLFNDCKTYPQLYDPKVRVDDQHLTIEGAAEFTRLLALGLVESARRP